MDFNSLCWTESMEIMAEKTIPMIPTAMSVDIREKPPSLR